jgi:hypothetical protein
MSFLERAKAAADQVSEQAKRAAEHAREAGAATAEKASAVAARANEAAWDPATAAKTRSTFNFARRGLSTAVERIDPGILADVIIKATTLQERANASLRAKGSMYRIGTLSIGAAIPPSVSFAIVRLGDPRAPGSNPDEHADVDEGEHLTAPSGGGNDDHPVLTLDGSHLQDADLAAALDHQGPLDTTATHHLPVDHHPG